MQDVARIVLAVDSEQLAQDVVDFLDRTGRARVVDTVRDPAAVREVVERERPDAVVGSPSLVRGVSLNGSALLAVATEESVRLLRDAVDAGAKGFFVWPADRAGLVAAAAGTVHPTGAADAKRATVIAVYGARGGAGSTFVATHLAAAAARRGLDAILVDADPAFGDATWALGVPEGSDVRTLRDLDPVRDEISEEHVQNVLWSHPSGVRALLAGAPGGGGIEAERYRNIFEACRSLCDVVVLHLPRSFDPVVAEAVEVSSRLLFVVTLDVLAFRAAKRAVEVLDSKRWDVVVNRASRGLVAPQDVERVFGRAPLAVLPRDRRVPGAQDRGELMPWRTPIGRALDKLAAAVVEGAS